MAENASGSSAIVDDVLDVLAGPAQPAGAIDATALVLDAAVRASCGDWALQIERSGVLLQLDAAGGAVGVRVRRPTTCAASW